MRLMIQLCVLLLIVLVLAVYTTSASEDLGEGFTDHGVATPVSRARGIVATQAGGENVVLVWLYDHRGGYAMLVIDAETGQSEQVPTPFEVDHDSPFTSLLGSNGKYYTHFGGHFLEFDPAKREFTFCEATEPGKGMGMTEDDSGRIWAGTHPDCGLVCFDPQTRELTDYGYVYQENFNQYPRILAADDAGWIYVAIRRARRQTIAFNPETEEVIPLVPEDERDHGKAEMFRAKNGKVYVDFKRGEGEWHELYEGEKTHLDELPKVEPKPIITGTQFLEHMTFPDGSDVTSVDFAERTMTITDTDGQERTVEFEYSSEGAYIMSLCHAPNDTLAGGTSHITRLYSYDPRTDEMISREALGQFNTVTAQDEYMYIGAYGGGRLQRWNPFAEYVETKKGDLKYPSNPKLLARTAPVINRPHDLLAYPDGNTIIMAGTPGYGLVGGGLLFWSRETQTSVLLEHSDILRFHSTMSLLALPDGKLLGATTTNPGTGGQRQAALAELYIMDVETRQLDWHAPLLPDVQSYFDLCHGPDGLVYGIIDRTRFFVFDLAQRKIVDEYSFEDELGETIYQQGTRVLNRAPDGTVYVLFPDCIGRVNPETNRIEVAASAPVKITSGGDFFDGRLYFAGGSHVYSWELPEG